MTNIIAAIIFIFISIVMITTETAVLRHYTSNSTLQANVVVEAKELQEFTQAAYDYSESFNVPLSTTALTVSNLQSYGLLPSTFPETTPFGQSFIAMYSTDTCNQDVMDLEVYASGNYNADLLSKNGLSGSLGVLSLNAQIENELSSLNMSFTNAHNPCVNGGPSFYIGQTLADSDIINLYGGGTVQSSNTAPSAGATVYVYAPNQWGYLAFTISNAIMNEWASTNGTVANINLDNLTNYPELNISGWGLSCPTGSTIITGASSQSYSFSLSSDNGRVFWTNGYCVPAYKSQVNSLTLQNQHNPPQVFNLSPGQSFYGLFSVGGTDPSNAYMYGGSNPISTGAYDYLSPINGINNNIYGVENYFQAYPPFSPIPNGQYPGANFISLEPLYNFFDSVGADISANGVVYQIVEWKYSLITGTGITPSQAGMNQCNPEGTCFPAGATIWQAPGGSNPNGINRGSSIDNYGGGYYITENPANSNSYSGVIDYVPYNNGPTYAGGFTIPTPLIN
ncbi:MAG: hypothetical protein M0016_02410 [Deltaproteobacteria bacterium]|jgi:hypothetical protein|nr:shufflon system plasmid conjugative transfer pilus tip adhesin PilV [Deltaproteobacteria bacterium]MDA8304000.1 hypothetical protein [Deltaproteobacteria bacterium]